jgi:DNA-binding transcriptional MerR regulator
MPEPYHSNRRESRRAGETFSSLEVSKMTGVSLRQLQWWDEQGVVSPTQRGHRRLYQMHEVVEVGLITELRQKGISLQKIRKVLAFLNDELGARLIEAVHEGGEIHLLTDGENLYLESNHHTIVDILKNSLQPLIGVCISDQVERLTAKLDVRKPAQSERGRVESNGRRASGA